MAYKRIALKQNKRLICFIVLFLCAIGFGFYWNYKMNYEMIVKFTQLDESEPNFPFGQRKINASQWIKKGYVKINDYQIYNPNPTPLEKDFQLASAISDGVERFNNNYPKLYAFFETKGSFDEFLKKDIKIKYINSTFNEDTNLPTDDTFLVTFDNYQIKVSRELKNDSFSLFAYDLKKISELSEGY